MTLSSGLATSLDCTFVGTEGRPSSGHSLGADAALCSKSMASRKQYSEKKQQQQKKTLWRWREWGAGRRVCVQRTQPCWGELGFDFSPHPHQVMCSPHAQPYAAALTLLCEWKLINPLGKQGLGTRETRYLVQFHISHFEIQKKGRVCVYISPGYLALGS